MDVHSKKMFRYSIFIELFEIKTQAFKDFINFQITLVMIHKQQQNTLYHLRWQILRREFLALSRFMLC